MKFKHRLFLAIFLVGAFFVAILALWNHKNRQEHELQAGLHLLMREATHHGQHLQAALGGMAQVVQTLGQSPLIIDALRRSNAEFAPLDDAADRIEALNARWMAAIDEMDPLIQQRTGNPVALYLKAHQQANPGAYGEIFVTNRHGAMIASTGRLTTLAHAQKYWWQAAFNDGQGRIFFDDRGFDQSVDGYVLGVVAPLYADGRFAGVIKANFNILHLLDKAVNPPEVLEGHAQKLVRSGGRIVLEAGHAPLSTELSSDITGRLAERQAGSMLLARENRLIAFAPIPITLGDDRFGFGGKGESLDHIQGNLGEAWFILVSEPEDVALADIQHDTRMLLWFGGALILVLAGAALGIGHYLTRPFEKLVAHARRIGDGDLETRLQLPASTFEFKQLADAVNQMSDRLQTTTISRNELAREVEERKKAEELARLNAGKMEAANQALQDFAHVASHDLQEPLRTVNSYAAFLVEDLPKECLADNVREDLSFITQAVGRMQSLIRDLLAYSRSGRLEFAPRPVALDGCMQATVDNLKAALEESGARVNWTDLPTVRGDAAALTSVLQNLVGNALKFRRPETVPEVRVEAKAHGDKWEIRVIDNGIGMEAQYLDQIFLPFQRLHGKKAYPGTGLGLAIVRRIVERHGGSITASSTFGVGSVFTLTLPLTNENRTEGAES